MSKCCGQGDTLLFACSGGSNVGQISNDAAKALDQLGMGSMYCLIGVGVQLPSFIERSKKEGTAIVAIDGCGVACAKKALENAGIELNAYVVVTELGIEKGHHFNITKEEVGKVAQATMQAINSEPVAEG
ncbi:MAG: putative zinc-binding protein [Armatimonadota bacterium]